MHNIQTCMCRECFLMKEQLNLFSKWRQRRTALISFTWGRFVTSLQFWEYASIPYLPKTWKSKCPIGFEQSCLAKRLLKQWNHPRVHILDLHKIRYDHPQLDTKQLRGSGTNWWFGKRWRGARRISTWRKYISCKGHH